MLLVALLTANGKNSRRHFLMLLNGCRRWSSHRWSFGTLFLCSCCAIGIHLLVLGVKVNTLNLAAHSSIVIDQGLQGQGKTIEISIDGLPAGDVKIRPLSGIVSEREGTISSRSNYVGVNRASFEVNNYIGESGPLLSAHAFKTASE